MPNQSQSIEKEVGKKPKEHYSQTPASEAALESSPAAEFPEFAAMAADQAEVQAQSAVLQDARIPLLQRQMMAGQMGDMQGNLHTIRVIQAKRQADQEINLDNTNNIQVQPVIQRDEDEDDFQLNPPNLSLPEYDGPHLDAGELTLDSSSRDNLFPTQSQLLEQVQQDPNQDLVDSLLTNPEESEQNGLAELGGTIPEWLKNLFIQPDIDNPYAHQDKLIESMEERDSDEDGSASLLQTGIEWLLKLGFNPKIDF